MISIHAPSRERHNINITIIFFGLFQSTLPRGSDSATSITINQFRISIHAPSRERQQILEAQACFTIISIHAPSRERRNLQGASVYHADFNPRSLAGATVIISNYCKLPIDFNPRSLAGATLAGWSYRQPSIQFQSTLPRGSDD